MGPLAGLMPSAILDKMFRHALEVAGDRDISTKLTNLTIEKGAEGRSLKLDITNQGTYYFVIKGGQLKYLKDKVITNPTTTASMAFPVFMDVFEKRVSAWKAWEHDTIKFESDDNRTLFHITLLMEMLEKMREIMGM